MDKNVHMDEYQSIQWFNNIDEDSYPPSKYQPKNNSTTFSKDNHQSYSSQPSIQTRNRNSSIIQHESNNDQRSEPQVYEDYTIFGVDSNQNDHYLDQGIFNMPGAFKSDPMDLDESPPFTIDLQFHVDTYETPNFAFNKPQSSSDPQSQGQPQHQIDHDQWQQQLLQEENSQDDVLQEKQESLSDQYQSQHNDNYLNPNNHLQFQNQQELSPFDASSMNSELTNNQFNSIQSNHNDLLRKDSFDSYYNKNVNYQNSHLINASNTASLLGINSIHNNQLHPEMSPLTTTTSLTPSVNSMHSTQPSFFSAHQYFSRNSIDHTPNQTLHGGHFDMYANRPSIDSQKPGRPSRFNTFSISNMIPFMNDRNQDVPVTPPSPKSYLNNYQQKISQSPPKVQPQSKGLLLRSIFKSNNNENNENSNFNNSNNFNSKQTQGTNNQMLESDFLKDYSSLMIVSPTKEEPEFDTMDYIPAKKTKKTKRSIFNRFKAPVKDEELKDEDLLKSVSVNSSFADPSNTYTMENNVSENFNTGLQSGINNQNNWTTNASNSSSSNILVHDTSKTSVNNDLDKSELDAQNLNTSNHDPDYAALFENVGKRKNFVNRKTKNKIKSEPQSDGSNQNSVANTEKSSVNVQLAATQSKGNGSSLESSNASSLHRQFSENSQTHTFEEDSMSPVTPTTNTSTFVSASKRILGSKLNPKRKAQTKEPVISNAIKGEEVAVDLSSLDLPPDTKIFPTSIINSKNRTRGRKENKQADMVDTSKIYLCNYCSRRFKRQEHLKRHFRSLHTFEKPYECNLCHKKFSRSDNLNQHLKIHKQEEEEAEAAAAAAATDGSKNLTS